ncbi:MAG: hypothetical protein WCB11_03730 [Terriglobales bacterium]
MTLRALAKGRRLGSVAVAISMIELFVIWGMTSVAEQTAQYDWRWAAPHFVDI